MTLTLNLILTQILIWTETQTKWNLELISSTQQVLPQHSGIPSLTCGPWPRHITRMSHIVPLVWHLQPSNTMEKPLSFVSSNSSEGKWLLSRKSRVLNVKVVCCRLNSRTKIMASTIKKVRIKYALYLYCDERRDIQWNIVWAGEKS